MVVAGKCGGFYVSEDAFRAEKALKEHFAGGGGGKLGRSTKIAKVSVVGVGMKSNAGVAARPLRSHVDVPGVDNSQMDGFALASADLAGPGAAVTLPLGPTIATVPPAGTVNETPPRTGRRES